MPIIKVLVGLIASGKSTYASKCAKKGAIIVNDDDIVAMLHGGDYLLYDSNLKRLYKSIENHIVGVAAAMNKDVVIDRGNNVTKNSRKRWIGLAKSLDISCEAVEFPIETLEVHAARRIKSDDRGYSYEEWLNALRRWYNQYEPPELSEGFDIMTKLHGDKNDN